MTEGLTEYVLYGRLKGFGAWPQLCFIGEIEEYGEWDYIIASALFDGIPWVLEEGLDYNLLFFRGRRRALRGAMAFWNMLRPDRLPAKDDERDFVSIARAPLDNYYLDFCTLEEFWAIVLDETSPEGFRALIDVGFFTPAELLKLNEEALRKSGVFGMHQIAELKMNQLKMQQR